MKVKIYVEGGGSAKKLKTDCRNGFSHFFEKAGLEGRLPAVVACGSRNTAYDRFRTAVSVAGPNELPLLLVDSESKVSQDPWKHLKSRDSWEKPTGVEDNQVHLMVECMESWFLADRACLKQFFGQGFSENALPGSENVEEIGKQKVFEALKKATKNCQSKGEYGKAAHSFKILGKLDLTKVRNSAKHAQRLLTFLDEKC